MSEVTRLLSQIDQGDPQAAEQLLPLVYDELRKLAAAKLSQENPGQTLQATALVHEAYLRLVGGKGREGEAPAEPPTDLRPPTSDLWHSRGHFFAAAAEAMRRILVDVARRKRTHRHGGGHAREELLSAEPFHIPIDDQLLDLDEALSQLATTDPQCAELVKLRIFAGLTVDEAAQLLAISPRTAKRNWAYARAWLGRHLSAYDPAST